jgi:hypothetical protein
MMDDKEIIKKALEGYGIRVFHTDVGDSCEPGQVLFAILKLRYDNNI